MSVTVLVSEAMSLNLPEILSAHLICSLHTKERDTVYHETNYTLVSFQMLMIVGLFVPCLYLILCMSSMA